MKRQTYRLGIIGTGRIARRFVPEARSIEGIHVAAVYNPRLSSAEEFAEELQIEYAGDNLEEFFSRVDAVYIAAPHETHVEYSRQTLMAGKHVLCEKPLSFSKKDAEKLFQLAEEKNCILMEGLKTAYCPGFKALLEVVQSGKIGQVVDVEACFSRISSSNVREIWDKSHGGSFTEFGTYSLLPIVKLLGMDDKKTNVWVLQGKTGVDVYTKFFIDYGRAAGLAKTGLAVKSEGQLVIAGTRGYILAPSPWWLTRYFEVRYEDPDKIERYQFTYEGSGLRYEIQEFVDRMNGSMETSLTPQEAIWFAEKMEAYLEDRKQRSAVVNVHEDGMCSRNTGIHDAKKDTGIWAHRGCSLACPENTLSAFRAAAELEGITGIELDVQLTKDNVMVVIHDETVDRTTNGHGDVCNFTLQEIKALEIAGKDNTVERIPTIEEVFVLLKDYCVHGGLLINIELKNSKVRYSGMEERLLELVKKYALDEYVVYSSFLPESMRLLKKLDPTVKTGILGMDMEWCREKANEMNADAIHPWAGGLELVSKPAGDEMKQDYPVRVWNMEEPFFGQNKVLKEKNLLKYRKLGATDIITNVPEDYL